MNEELLHALTELVEAADKVIEYNTIKFGRFEFIEAVRKAEKTITQTKQPHAN